MRPLLSTMNAPMSLKSLNLKDQLAELVKAGRFFAQSVGRFKRTTHENIAIERIVAKLDELARSVESNGVVSHHLAFSMADVSRSSTTALLDGLAEG